MDNAYNQSTVAYEDGPKEVNNKRGMPNSKEQFGNGNKMAQDEKKPMKKASMHSHRHKEHR